MNNFPSSEFQMGKAGDAVQKKCVIFDMDGVLVDTAPFHIEAWKIFGERHSVEVTREFFYKTFGMKNNQIFNLLLKKEIPEEELKSLDYEKEAIYRDCIRGKAVPFPGVLALFADLNSKGFITTIGSSGCHQNVELIIEELELGSYVKDYVSGDSVSVGKPDPSIFNKSAELSGTGNAGCLVIEDAVVGIEAARAAGMASIAVTNSFPAEKLKIADLVVDSLAKVNAEIVDEIISINAERST